MVAAGELMEHARVFGRDYGTPRLPVENALRDGKDVLFDIDWQGAQQLAEATSDSVVRIFILPPSPGELGRRLRNRAQDTEEALAARLAKAADEMTHWAEYDYLIVNDRIERAVEEAKSILAAERLRRHRFRDAGQLVARLQAG